MWWPIKVVLGELRSRGATDEKSELGEEGGEEVWPLSPGSGREKHALQSPSTPDLRSQGLTLLGHSSIQVSRFPFSHPVVCEQPRPGQGDIINCVVKAKKLGFS